MWTIDKSFNFEAGHRVWSQKLDHAHLSISTECACKKLHGHSYKLKVFLSADTLDKAGMVTDFKNLGFVKEFLDKEVDHKFIIDCNDPNFEIITGVNLRGSKHCWVNLVDVFPDADPNIELHRGSFIVVDFVPTSENLCKQFLYVFQDILGDVAKISAVELWETEKSHSRYERD